MLKIAMNKTVKDLKTEIKNLFNLNYDLSNQELRVQNPGKKNTKVITAENETKILFDLHIISECIIKFGKQQNNGGS